MTDSSWLTKDVVAAVVRHMNDDHGSDSVLIAQHCTGIPDIVSAVTTDIDLNGITFAVTTSGGETNDVVVPFSKPLTSRADIRAEVVRMHAAAGDHQH